MLRPRSIAPLLVLGLALLVPATAHGGENACAGFEPVEVGGTITEPRLIEVSGLAASRRNQGVLWAHNDSGGAAEVYAMHEDGTALGAYAYPVEGATATDWEDMAVGPGADAEGDFLFIGDIGDNAAARPSVTVYRVPEPGPTLSEAPLSGAEAIELQYPDGPADAEALLVDPRTGDLVIVTKSLTGASRVLVAAAASLVAGAPVTMTDAGGLRVPLPPAPGGGLPGTMVTGGDVSPDGSLVVLRTYRSVLVYERGDDQTVAEALLGEPCFGPQEEEEQGEALAFTWDGTAYVTASEGVNPTIHRVGFAIPAATTTTEPTTTTAEQPGDEEGESDDGASIAAVLIGGGAVLLVLGGGALYLSRRRGSAG